jgi:small GTP-binding protein
MNNSKDAFFYSETDSETDSDEVLEKTHLPEKKNVSKTNSHDYYIVKCAIIGEPNVGKTAILTKYTKNIFMNPIAPTIGIDYFMKTIDIVNTDINYKIKLQLWDTAGQEKFKSLVNSYLRSCYLFFIVFDITRWETFVRCAWWLQQIFNYRHILDKETDNKYPIVLVGNMSDCSKREVSNQIAIDWAEENNLIGYYEVSAKTGSNLDNLFEDALCDIVKSNELENNVDKPVSGITFNSISNISKKSIEKNLQKSSTIIIRNSDNSEKQNCCINI